MKIDSEMKLGSRIAIGVFLLVCLAHLHRLVFRWEVLVNGKGVPMWTSIAGMLISGGLAFLIWKEMRGANRKDRKHRKGKFL